LKTWSRSKKRSRISSGSFPRNGLLLGNGDDANLAPLLKVTHCPVKRFGLGEDNAVHAFNIRYGPDGERV